MRRLFPSPAMVVALVALGVALGGSAVAATGLISGAEIRNHSIGLAKLSPAAVRALRGQRGPQGTEGPAGTQGAAGTIDPSRVSFESSGDVEIGQLQVGTAQALCPSGSFVIAGGAATTAQDLAASYPTTNGTQSGWSAIAVGYSTPTISKVTAYAVCIRTG